MKTTNQLFGIVILTFGSLFLGHAQDPFTNGLVAYYPFNGNANDASGNGNNGTVNGASLTTDRFGSTAAAYLFSGGQAIITTLASPAGTDARTVTGWFRTGGQDRQAILAYGGDGTGHRIEVGVNTGSFYLDIYDGAKFWSGNFANSAWHQFILVCIANSTLQDAQLFIDGVNITASSGGSPLLINTGNSIPMEIGDLFYPGDRRYFTGQIDDIRIYSHALSPSEASQLYSSEAQFICTPHKATATATLVNGFFVGSTITDSGCGYTNAPVVLIQGGGGGGATATATVNNGFVTALNITDAGFGYTSIPKIVIGSPPFVPTVSIAVSKVKVTQNVVLGRTYVLETSTDFVTWTATGPQFTADSETIVTEFDVDVIGRFFRLRQVL